MQETEYGPNPEDVLVFDFDYRTLKNIREALDIHDDVVGRAYNESAKYHAGDAAWNAIEEDALLGIEKEHAPHVQTVLEEIGNLNIHGYEFRNSTFARLADEFNRQLERADTADEVGMDRVETEEY